MFRYDRVLFLQSEMVFFSLVRFLLISCFWEVFYFPFFRWWGGGIIFFFLILCWKWKFFLKARLRSGVSSCFTPSFNGFDVLVNFLIQFSGFFFLSSSLLATAWAWTCEFFCIFVMKKSPRRVLAFSVEFGYDMTLFGVEISGNFLLFCL